VTYVDEAGNEHGFIERFLMDKYNLKRCGYDACFHYFDETHDKVGSQYVIARTEPQRYYEIVAEKEMTQRYKHYSSSGSDSEGEHGKAGKSFIFDYLADDRIDAHQKFGVYPGALRAPPGVFDLWTPFAVESLLQTHSLQSDLSTRVADLTIILTRVLVLSNHEKASYDFILTWLGHMFQYPEIKAGVILCFLSKQGAGKSEFMRLLQTMLGLYKVFISTTPEKHVWGQFNMALANAFLVVLNEVGEAGFAKAAGKIKALITDGTIQVEEKFVKQVTIESYHRWMMTAQVKDGRFIPTEDAERRYFIGRCSDELCVGHLANHTEFARVIKTPQALIDFYDFLMVRDVPKRPLGKEDVPVTTHQRELNAANRDPIEQFVVAIASEPQEVVLTRTNVAEYEVPIIEGVLKATVDEVYLGYRTFCTNTHVTGVGGKNQFFTQLGHLKISGVSKGKNAAWSPYYQKTQRHWQFNLAAVREKFNLAGDVAMADDTDDAGAAAVARPDPAADARAFLELVPAQPVYSPSVSPAAQRPRVGRSPHSPGQ